MSYAAGLLLLAKTMAFTKDEPSDAVIRRAVSTAYYAMFHTIALAGAECLAPGSAATAGYRLIYRGFNHGRLREVFRALDVAMLSPAMRGHLGRATVSPALRTVAANFVDLQNLRHRADYEPEPGFTQFDAQRCVLLADAGIEAVDIVPEDELADVLTLMLVGNRDR